MEHFDFIVLGAGPTGLSYARSKQLCGSDNFLIIEKENTVGGLCRSTMTKWGMADTGGGHMFCTKYPEVEKFVTSHLGASQWLEYDRKSTCIIESHEIDYPIEEHLWQFPEDMAIEMSRDSIQASAVKKLDSGISDFESWVKNKFGNSMSEKYMLPYNMKLWGEPLNRLSLDWLHKLPSPDSDMIIKSLIRKSSNKEKLFHRKWKYPKYGGFQRVIDSIAEPIKKHILTSTSIETIEIKEDSKSKNGFRIEINGQYSSNKIITTVPWDVWKKYCSNASSDIGSEIKKLEAVPLSVELVPPTQKKEDTQWTYYPDKKIYYHRKFFTSRWMPGAKFDFTETNTNRYKSLKIKPSMCTFHSKYAYPVYTHDREDVLYKINKWSKKYGIIPMGRWGTYDYANSDVCIHHVLKQVSKEEKITTDMILEKI